MNLKNILLATSFVSAAGVTAWVLTRAPASEPAHVVAPAATDALTLTLAPGQRLDHRVVLSQDVTVTSFGARGGEMTAQTSLDVVVRVVGLERTAAGTRAALSFAQVDAAEVTFADQDLIDDAARAALTQAIASVELGADGRVRALATPVGAHPMFARLVPLVLAETQLTLGAGPTWQAEERTAAATVAARYTRADDAHGSAVTRTASLASLALPGLDVGAATLEGRRTLRIAGGGVRAQRGEEHLIARDAEGRERFAQHTHVEVTLVDEGTAPAPTLAALAPVDPYVVQRDDAAAAAQALVQRIDGLTREQLLAAVDGALATGTVPDHDHFLWRATGLLQQQPASAASLKPLFFDARARHEGRALILDLLVGAKNDTAQAVLVELLDSDVVAQDAQAILLRQRLSFVRRPSAATLAFVTAKAQGSDAWRDPARMSLGSMAGALARSGRGAEAQSAAELLVARHGAATDAGERDVLVRALGNAGIDGYDAPILAATRDPDGRARASAASALRKMKSERARDALLVLATDADAAVARRAIDSLGERPFDARVSAALKEALAQRAIVDGAYQAVVSVLARQVAVDADARAALELMLGHDVQDREVKPRIRAILGRLGT